MIYRESSAKWIVLFVLVIVIIAAPIGLTLYISELHRKLDSEQFQNNNFEQRLANEQMKVADLTNQNAALIDQTRSLQRQHQTDIGYIQAMSQSLSQLQSQLLLGSATTPRGVLQAQASNATGTTSISVLYQPALIAISALCLVLLSFNFKVAVQVQQERDDWMAESQMLRKQLREQAEKVTLIRHHYQAIIHAERQHKQPL